MCKRSKLERLERGGNGTGKASPIISLALGLLRFNLTFKNRHGVQQTPFANLLNLAGLENGFN